MALLASTPTLVESIVDELRRLILEGRYGLGEKLVEERLSEEFGVSRPPLREALRILQRDGLVTSIPRRGTYVARLTSTDVEEIYSLRWALESLAAKMGVPVRDKSRLAGMERALDAMRVATDATDIDALVDSNWSFHRAFCALPNHRRLLDAYDSLTLQLRLCMSLNLDFRRRYYSDVGETVERHEVLLDLVKAGKQDELLSEMASHGDRAFLPWLSQLLEDSEIADQGH